MTDKPFRVERHRVLHRNDWSERVETEWSIVQSGIGTVCKLDDVTWAYRLADLLNEQYVKS